MLPLRPVSAFLLCFLCNLACMALPAKPGLVNASQPDGSSVRIYLHGDEFSHFALSEDGLVLTSDSDGYYVYASAVDSDGMLVPSSCRAVDIECRSLELTETLEKIKGENLAAKLSLNGTKRMSRRNGPGLYDNLFPYEGEPRTLVILVQFPDKKFSMKNPVEFYSRMLNEENFSDYNATGSARDYFIQNSLGKFAPYFDVYGPVTLEKGYYYYGQNMLDNDLRPGLMVVEACTLLDDEIDFASYDFNGDGKVDNIYVFYAGLGEADGGGADTIWPHSWDITSAYRREVFLDGVQLDHYACSNELQNYTGIPDGIGTFCHEFGHVIGLPDLYATSYSKAFTPGKWDVMDQGSYNNNSRTPPFYSAFERYALNWLEPEPLDYGDFELLPIYQSNKAFIVSTKNENEFFLFENRQQEGFDKFIPWHGMLVWHIDYDPLVWINNKVNNDPDHQYVDLVEADNLQEEINRKGDCYPGARRKTEFSCFTEPALKTWSGRPLPYCLSDIREVKDMVISFTCSEVDVSGVFNPSSVELMSVQVNGNEIRNSGVEPVIVSDIAGRSFVLTDSSVMLSPGLYIISKGMVSSKILIP